MLKRNALGRGLDALITMDEVKTSGTSSINEINIDLIKPNPDQPRTEFDEEALEELASSIKELGIIQPVSLRKMKDGSYQIIAGERRYRASKLAGLKSMPAYVRTVEDETVMEMALIENIQREDLNAVEIALTFQKLIEQYNLTQEKLSERIGKKRTTIANYLRLLRLPAEIQLGLKNKVIDMGHARALLSLDDASLQLKLYEEIKLNGYSVRKVEERAKELTQEETPIKKASKKSSNSYDTYKKELISIFKTRVKIVCDETGKGKISIPFKDGKEFERIKELLNRINAEN
ncbi:MAG: ParB/RepB/Spo0J family partition protein [Bacteroidales bacterium]|nr:ParB/RepB/Spo0J family partition protein [Bacteroidales bacterium]MBR5532918.1 ParB/RepB/Spo0J family partition protein [Bacteroidales bacterium]